MHPEDTERSTTQDLLRRRIDEREALMARVRQVLLADRRVIAAWLYGSIGRGEGDAFSDLDVMAVIADDEIARVAGSPARPATFRAIRDSPRGRFVSRVGEPVLLLEAPQNAPRGGAFLSSFFPGAAGPQGIDWVWQPVSTANVPSDSLVLFNREMRIGGSAGELSPMSDSDARSQPNPTEVAVQAVCSFWSMLLWSAKGIARNPSARSMPLLRYAADALDKLHRLRTGEPVDPVIDGPLDSGADKVRVLRAYAERMRTLLAGLDVEVDVPPRVPAQVEDLLGLIEDVVARRPGG